MMAENGGKGTWPHERSKETSRNAKKIFAKTPNLGAEATGQGHSSRWIGCDHCFRT